MNKSEFEKEAKKYRIERVKRSDAVYDKKITYYIDFDRTDLYGIFKNENKKYVLFYKSIEREISKKLGEFDTEEDTYDSLLIDLKCGGEKE